jgi:CsoR family transcriptional regulator, copper-sensing transcriptional repressor
MPILPPSMSTEGPGPNRSTAGGTLARSSRTMAPRGYEKDRAQLLRRLARIEGQVRGITRMIERDEYCVDVMQQTAALRAAVDSVTLLLMEDHVAGCLAGGAVRGQDTSALAEEVMEVVRRTMGRPARAPRSGSD